MKEGWLNKTLGEVCKIYNGNSINADYKKKHFSGATGGLPFIATKDVSSLGTIDYNNGVRIPNYEEYKVAPANSVFICAEGGSAGKKFAYVEEDVCFGNKLFCITPKEKSLLGKYVYHFVQSDNFKGQFFALLTGLIGGVSAKKFQTIEIPLPPLSEQQSIVDYLDSAFAKIDAMKANAEKALNEAKALFQASLKEMLEPKEGWEEKKLGEICTFSQGVQVPLQNQSLKESAGYTRFLRIIDFTQGSEPPRYVPINDAKYWMNHEDIAIVRYGASTGFICTGLEGTLANNLFRLNIKCDVSPHYLIYVLKSEIFQSVIKVQMNGAAMPAISFGLIEGIKMPIPSHSEQQSIVETLDSLKSKVDRLQENYDKISQECDALKQTILRQVFE